MNDHLVRRSIVSHSLARFLNSLLKINSESLENLVKENYQFQVADSLNCTFEQIRKNLELKERNLLIDSKDKLKEYQLNKRLNLSIEDLIEENSQNFNFNNHQNPINSIPIDSKIKQFKTTFNSEPSSLKRSTLPLTKFVCESSSYTSNNTLDSLNSLNTSDLDINVDNNLKIHQQSLDSGLSTLLSNSVLLSNSTLSPTNFVQQNNKLEKNLNCKKDEQAFISNLLYFLNLKNENELMSEVDNGLLINDSFSDNLPEQVALNLIKVFSKREPSFKIDPNELDCWLVSEQEVPQKLLPIPNNGLFLTHHFNQAKNLTNVLDEKGISFSPSTKNYSGSSPINIQIPNTSSISNDANSTPSQLDNCSNDNLIERMTMNGDKLIDDEHKSSLANFSKNNLTNTKSTDESDEIQKLNEKLFHNGKFLIFSSLNNVKCRGNLEWAPPRSQIHVVIHQPPKRLEQIAKQNYRCAGCGLQIKKQEISRVLYCYYTGKYFCKYGCHSQMKTIIPGYIINKWSFRLYPVSNFAFNLIQSNFSKPLFNIQDLNPKLFNKVKQFQNLNDLREQLLKLKEYIFRCKKAGNLLIIYLTFEPKHFIESSKYLTYSLEDLVEINKDCKILKSSYDLVCHSIAHIKNCSNCLALGHFCELCSTNQTLRQTNRSLSNSVSNRRVDILFPFESGRVKQCEKCYACYHLNCYAQNGFKCVKCLRIERRRSSSSFAEN